MKLFVTDLGAVLWGDDKQFLRNIGSTTLLLEWKEKNNVLYRILLDMGLKTKYRSSDNLEQVLDITNLSRIEEYMFNKRLPTYKGGIQCIVLSHVHTDHAGGLPWFYEMMRKYNETNKDNSNNQIIIPKLYMTYSTWKQFHIYHDDLYDLFQRPAESTGSHYCWNKNILNFIASNKDYVGYYRPFPIVDNRPKDFDIILQFIPAGHIPGSAMIEIDTLVGGKSLGKVLFTGDICIRKGSFLVDPADPKGIINNTKYTGLITEFTYGFNRLYNRKLKTKGIMPILMEKINNTISKGGNIVLLVYGIDRTANIISALTQLLRSKMINVNLNKIYLHTKIGTDITEEYLKEFYVHKYADDADTYLAESHIRLFNSGLGPNIFELGKDTGPIFQVIRGRAKRDEIIKDGNENGGYIVIATSATFIGGTAFMVDSYAHPNGWGSDKKNLFLIVGSAIPDIAAQRASEKYRENGECELIYWTMNEGKFYPVPGIFSSTLEELSEFSAHANFVELEQMINNLKSENLIITHMGNPPPKNGMHKRLRYDEAFIYVHDTCLLGVDPVLKRGEKLKIAKQVYVLNGENWGEINLADIDDLVIRDATTKDMIRTKVKKEKNDFNHNLMCDEIRRLISEDDKRKAIDNKSYNNSVIQ